MRTLLLSFSLLLCVWCGSASGFVTNMKVIDFFIQIDKSFLNAIQPQPGLKSFLFAITNSSNVATSAFNLIVSNTYLGYFILFLIGFVMFCLAIISCIAFFVCRLCLGRCGAYIGPIDDLHSNRKRLVYGVLLGLFSTAMLFFFTITVLSNIATHEALENSTNRILHSLNETQKLVSSLALTYKDDLIEHISQESSAVSNFANASKYIFKSALQSDANLVDALKNTDQFLTVFLGYLTSLGDFAGQELITAGNNFSSTLTSLKSSLMSTLRTDCDKSYTACMVSQSCNMTYTMCNDSMQMCSGSSFLCNGTMQDCNITYTMCFGINEACNGFNSTVCQATVQKCNSTSQLCNDTIGTLSSVTLGFNYTNVNITEPKGCLNTLSSFNTTKFQENINQTNKIYETIGISESALINDTLWNITSILKSPSTLGTYYFSQMDPLINLFSTSIKNASDTLKTYRFIIPPIINASIPENGLQMIDNFRFYACICANVLTGILILLFYMGLSFGSCGEPAMEDASFCNKGRGASILKFALFLIISVFWLLVLMQMILFFSGGLVETEVCRYFNNNNTDPLNELANAFFQQVNPIDSLNNVTKNIVKTLLVTCSTNKSLVADLGFSAFVRFDEAFLQIIQPQLNSTRVRLSQMGYSTGIMNITDALTALKANFPCMSKTSANILLKETISPIPAADLIKALNFVMSKIGPTNGSLASQINQLDAAISTMTNVKIRYFDVFNDLNIADDIIGNTYLPLNLEKLPVVMNNINGNSRSLAVATTMNYVSNALSAFIKSLITDALNTHSDCSLLSAELNDAIYLACNSVVAPFNAFTGSMGMLLICLVPCIFLAGGLSSLYRKSIKYSGDAQKDIIFMPSQIFYPLDSNGKPIGRTFFLARMEEKNAISEV